MAKSRTIRSNREGTSRAGPISNTLSSGSQNKDSQASSSMLNNSSTRNTPRRATAAQQQQQSGKSRSGRSNSSGKTTITSRNAPSSSNNTFSSSSHNSNRLSNSNSGRTHNSKTVLGSNSTINKPHRTPQQQRVQQSAWQQHRSRNWQSDHRTWQQRGGYRGYRIPDDRYRSYFGPSHGFRIQGLPFLVVGGYPRFQYQGYWMSAVDPWPDSLGR